MTVRDNIELTNAANDLFEFTIHQVAYESGAPYKTLKAVIAEMLKTDERALRALKYRRNKSGIEAAFNKLHRAARCACAPRGKK